MGCLASHIAWNHPATAHMGDEAGVCWLTKIAGLNPATSRLILAWDDATDCDWELRRGLLAACREEMARRATPAAPAASCAAPAGEPCLV